MEDNWRAIKKSRRESGQPSSSHMHSQSTGLGSSDSIPRWDPFEDEKDDPSKDPHIQTMREQHYSELGRLSRSGTSRLEDQDEGQDDAQSIRLKRLLTIDVSGYAQKGDTYQPFRAVKRSIELPFKRTPFRRNLQRTQLHLQEKDERHANLEGSGLQQMREAYRNRAKEMWYDRKPRQPLIPQSSGAHRPFPYRRDPYWNNRYQATRHRDKQWSGLKHRKVYQRSPFMVRRTNIRAAADQFHSKRQAIREGSPNAPGIKRCLSPVAPGIKRRLHPIDEEREPEDTAQYFPQQFTGFPTRTLRPQYSSPESSPYSPSRFSPISYSSMDSSGQPSAYSQWSHSSDSSLGSSSRFPPQDYSPTRQ